MPIFNANCRIGSGTRRYNTNFNLNTSSQNEKITTTDCLAFLGS